MAESVLHVENVTMQFGGVVAVNNLSMDIYEGEIVALIGPNGAGKTTAFNCITGVYEPTNGKVEFCGKTIVENHPQGKMKKLYAGDSKELYPHVVSHTPDYITKMGIARTFQNIRLFKSMTVFDNVLTAMHLRKTSSQKTELSLDEPLNTDWDGNELLLSDVLGTENDLVMRPIEADVDRQLLRQALDRLEPRERHIISLRFGLDGAREQTQKEVADRLGISQSYISRLEKRIIARLKKEIVRMM